MGELQMPSDVKKSGGEPVPPEPPIEPPSAKLIVRLFLIPLIIVAAAVGVMFLIGLLAGREPSMEEALARLKSPGGGRTANYLVGPASKQRYLDAKTLVDKMKAPDGMTQSERIALAGQLIDILENHTNPDEGEVQHFILLALGRTWQKHPSQPEMDDEQAIESRRKVLRTLLRHMDAPALATRKAAVLATVYLAGQPEAAEALPRLVSRLTDPREDLDVRLAAATALGPLADPSDAQVIAALQAAMRENDPRNVELVWSSALSLAQLNQHDVADTILKLLDRSELAGLEIYDREKDPSNPVFRKLSDQEQQRILINTMIGARHLDVPAVQQRLRELSQSDPSPRVREAAMEVLSRTTSPGGG